MSVQAFNLGDEAHRYLQGVPKGSKSKLVNRAILYYKDSGQIMVARDRLQERVLELSTELEELRAQKVESDPPSRGWSGRFWARIRSKWL